MKQYFLFGLVAVILLIAVAQAVQINELKKEQPLQVTGNAVKTGTQASGGETYEEMMARMHPDQVQQVQQPAQRSSAPTMVGGC